MGREEVVGNAQNVARHDEEVGLDGEGWSDGKTLNHRDRFHALTKVERDEAAGRKAKWGTDRIFAREDRFPPILDLD